MKPRSRTSRRNRPTGAVRNDRRAPSRRRRSAPPITRPHMSHSRHDSMHLSEIGDGRAPLDLFGSKFVHGREDRRHGDVHPYGDWPEFLLCPCRRNATAERPRHQLESAAPGRQTSQLAAARPNAPHPRDKIAMSKPLRANSVSDRTANACASAGDHDDLAHPDFLSFDLRYRS